MKSCFFIKLKYKYYNNLTSSPYVGETPHATSESSAAITMDVLLVPMLRIDQPENFGHF